MLKRSTAYSFMVALGFTVTAETGTAWAHHPSGATGYGAGPIVTISATTLEAGESAISFTFETIQLHELSDNILLAGAAADQHMHSVDTISSYALSYAYGITNDLTFSLRLPWLVRTGIREGHHEHGAGGAHNEIHDLGDTAGIGDLTLLGQYRFYNNRAAGLEVALLGGIKAPTGKTGEYTDDGEERFATEFQPGSGSWDGLLGLALTRRIGPWSIDTNVLYTLAGDGAQDTNLGDRFQYNAAVSYRLSGLANNDAEPPHGHTNSKRHRHTGYEPSGAAAPAVDLVLELNGEWSAKQEEDGTKDKHSGGNTVYLSPGLRVSADNWSGFVSVGIPIVNDLNGTQAEPDLRVLSGFSVSLH